MGRNVILWITLGWVSFQLAPLRATDSLSKEQNLFSVVKKKSPQKNKKCDLTVAGFVEMADGLGKQSVELIEELQDTCRISFIPTRGTDESKISQLPTSIKNIVRTSGIDSPGKCMLFFDALFNPPTDDIPNGFWKRFGLEEKNSKQIRIAYSMFESSRIAKGWVYALNKFFDAVVVPDSFLVKVYQDSGVRIPIFVVPLGTQLKDFLCMPLKQKKGNPFIFANFSTCDQRKDQLTLVRAFYKAFGTDSNVLLKLCWRCSKEKYRAEVLGEIAKYNMKNVIVEEEAVDRKKYIERFMGVDCYVNLSLGEGFSIPPREAMALGIPVIVSNNTAQTTICESGLALGVPGTIEGPARYFFPGDFGVQHGCSIDDSARALREMYERYEYYLQKGSAARKWASLYDYSAVRSLYLGFIKPKIVRLGNENKISPEGITTTSRRLGKKYSKIMKIKGS